MCLHNYIGNLHVATCSPLETTSTDRLKAFFFISLSKWFLITLFNLITLWQSMEYRTHHHHYSDLAPNIQHIFYFAHAFPIWFCAQLGNRVAKYWNIQLFWNNGMFNRKKYVLKNTNLKNVSIMRNERKKMQRKIMEKKYEFIYFS